ncbi:MAG: glycerate kinase [Acidimicrobiales bacterium]
MSEAAVGAADRLGWDSCAIPLADGGEDRSTSSEDRTRRRSSPRHSAIRSRPAGGSTVGPPISRWPPLPGLTVVGGADQNDAVAADTTGTGELISTAIELGATTVVVFLGGSATTDGGGEPSEPCRRRRA